MKLILFPLILLFLSILSASCTKELKYSKEDLLEKIRVQAPSAKFILPKGVNEGIHCEDYTSGCLSGHILNILNLQIILVEFETEEQAIRGATKIRGYYLRNWVFDDVRGEPMLEKFVEEKLEAKKP